MRVCAISVDLDEIQHYYGIHGLDAAAAPGAALHAVYERGLARFVDFARAEQIPLTFFVVGADLAHPGNARALALAARAGHELGNHTFDHLYGLSRRPDREVLDQIVRCNDVLEAATGARPTGFRAPGYLMSDRVYAALGQCSMSYSSSVFPCPYYYAAKLAKISSLRLRGRASQSVVDSPRVLGAPRGPYRVGQPYWQSGTGVLELPIQVTPILRLPFIGTSLTLLGPELGRRLATGLRGLPFINLELHGVDLLDEHDHLGELAPHQFDLRISVERKWATLTAVVAELRSHGYSFVRLDEAARMVSV
jgi:peptidoglycan-N-acetylglucosamine deacetylase